MGKIKAMSRVISERDHVAFKDDVEYLRKPILG